MAFAARLLAALLCLAMAIGAPLDADAAGRRKISKEVLTICRRAEGLLDKLEYERGRELLESSVRNKRYNPASPASKAKLWALLGRARAELGDMVGTDEAFLEAVRWDRRVQLSKRTSPKILEALERARANAPVPGRAAPTEPPSERAPADAARKPDAVAQAEDRGSSRSRASDPKAGRGSDRSRASDPKPDRRDPKADRGADARADRGADRNDRSADPKADRGSDPKPDRSADPRANRRPDPKDRAADRRPDPKDRAADRRSDPKDRAADRRSDPKPDRAADRRSDPKTDRTADRRSDPKADRAADRRSDRPDRGSSSAARRDPSNRAADRRSARSAARDSSSPSTRRGAEGPPTASDPSTPGRAARPPRARPTGPWVDHAVVGAVAPRATVEIVVSSGNLPRRAKLELLVRKSQSGGFVPAPLTRTGTVSVHEITLDRPRIEYFVRAMRRKETVAQLGSERQPLVLTTVPAPPPIAQAWSNESPQPSPPPPVVATSTATASAPPPGGAVPAPTTVSYGSGLDTTEVILLVAGGVVIVASVAVAAILLSGSNNDCEAEEGFGCTEVRVLPLLSF